MTEINITYFKGFLGVLGVNSRIHVYGVIKWIENVCIYTRTPPYVMRTHLHDVHVVLLHVLVCTCTLRNVGVERGTASHSTPEAHARRLMVHR